MRLLFGCLPTSVLCFLTFLRKVSGFPFSEDNYLACGSSCTSCLSISSSLHHCSKSHGVLLSSRSCSRWLRCFFFPGIWLVVGIFSLKIFYNNCKVFYIFCSVLSIRLCEMQKTCFINIWGEKVWKKCVTFIYSFIYLFISMCFNCVQLMALHKMIYQLQSCPSFCCTCHKQKMYWDTPSTPQYCLNIVCLHSTIHLATSTSNLLSFCFTHQETKQLQGQYYITHPVVKKIFLCFHQLCVCDWNV